MHRRPWPITILAIAQFFAPFTGLYVSAWAHHAPYRAFVASVIQTGSFWNLAELFALPVATGVSMLIYRKWTYPLFIAAMMWTFGENIFIWLKHPTVFGILPIAILNVPNLGVIAYFCVPGVRRVYFDARIRWWESKPRYQVDWNAGLDRGSSHSQCRVRDISEGGLFFEIEKGSALQLGEMVRIHLKFSTKEFSVPGKVVHKRERGQGNVRIMGAGILFGEISKPERKAINGLIKELKRQKFKTRDVKGDTAKSFVEWAKTAATTGKGLIPAPEQPNKVPAAAPAAEATDSEDHKKAA